MADAFSGTLSTYGTSRKGVKSADWTPAATASSTDGLSSTGAFELDKKQLSSQTALGGGKGAVAGASIGASLGAAAATGGLMGSVVPGVGTLIGAGIGVGVGLLGGALAANAQDRKAQKDAFASEQDDAQQKANAAIDAAAAAREQSAYGKTLAKAPAQASVYMGSGGMGSTSYDAWRAA